MPSLHMAANLRIPGLFDREYQLGEQQRAELSAKRLRVERGSMALVLFGESEGIWGAPEENSEKSGDQLESSRGHVLPSMTNILEIPDPPYHAFYLR